jgi:hypothetical protein
MGASNKKNGPVWGPQRKKWSIVLEMVGQIFGPSPTLYVCICLPLSFSCKSQFYTLLFLSLLSQGQRMGDVWRQSISLSQR